MRRVFGWSAVAVVILLLAAGCQKIQYKVVRDLPGPLFGDEVAAKVAPAGPRIALTPTPTPAATPPPVKHDPTPRVCRAPVPDWERHVADNGWKYIIIHHSASDRGGAAAFDREHRAKGWDELGYHFVIGNGSDTRDGQVEVGSRWRSQKHGAHCKTNDNRYNDFGVGICLVGDFENGGHPSAAQMAALEPLVAWLAERYNIPNGNILGHGEAVAQFREGRGTKCPGRNFDMDLFRRAVRTARLGKAADGRTLTAVPAD